MKALMIEDDHNIVEIVSLGFKMRCPDISVVSASLGEKGILLSRSEAPDIIILDLGLPDLSGFEVLASIRKFSSVPVLVLSVRAEERDITKGIELGADDYVLKPFRQTELIGRVKALIQDRDEASEEPCRVCGPLQCFSRGRKLLVGGSPVAVTATEFDIIRCLMQNAGKVVSSRVLCEAVWCDDNKGLEDSLKLHIKRLRWRIEADPDNPKLLMSKPGAGYYLAV